MTWLIVIVAIVLVITFWRIFLPLGVLAAVGLGALILYFQIDMNRSERERKATEQAVRERIAKARATEGAVRQVWKVALERDPASNAEVPRYASVLSDDGLCRLQVEERISGAKLAAILCPGLKIASTYEDTTEVKFDNRATSDRMGLRRFSDGDAYIPSTQDSFSRHLSYDELLRRMTAANRLALLLNFQGAGQHWIAFSLEGSGPALMQIGALSTGSRK